jgi:hypothetical protein
MLQAHLYIPARLEAPAAKKMKLSTQVSAFTVHHTLIFTHLNISQVLPQNLHPQTL